MLGWAGVTDNLARLYGIGNVLFFWVIHIM